MIKTSCLINSKKNQILCEVFSIFDGVVGTLFAVSLIQMASVVRFPNSYTKFKSTSTHNINFYEYVYLKYHWWIYFHDLVHLMFICDTLLMLEKFKLNWINCYAIFCGYQMINLFLNILAIYEYGYYSYYNCYHCYNYYY